MFSLLSLFDDIAATLDDVSIMTKVAIKKTATLMSDDLAVNADVLQGTSADQELPVVWKIFVGSLLNKVYCIIGVLTLVATFPPLLKLILLLGGIYLSYEGAHKVHSLIKRKNEEKLELSEQEKIKGAIRTDLILSIEIMVIAHSNMSGSFLNQALSLTIVGLLASVLIYGLVAILVKIDDFGLFLIKKSYKKLGLLLVQSMPYIMRGLGFIGTIAMFLVGGGIVSHTFHLPIYTFEILQNLVLGLLTGLLALLILELFHHLKFKKP